MNTLEILQYYPNLLIVQYGAKPRAYATVEALVRGAIMPQTSVQTVTFAPVPTAGTFELSYDGTATGALAWNASAATVQAALEGLAPGVISGGIASTASWDDLVYAGNASTDVWNELIGGGNAYGWGLSTIQVTGSIASGTLTVTFDGAVPPVDLIALLSNTLTASGAPDAVTV